MTEIKLRISPTPVGYWVLYAEASPQTYFAMYHKPTDEQIANTERLLGWTWRDARNDMALPYNTTTRQAIQAYTYQP